MFHLLVKGSGWSESTDTLDLGRVFEYTKENLQHFYMPNGNFNIQQICGIPALFVSESRGAGAQFARVGYISHISINSGKVLLTYTFDPDISPISNMKLESLSNELGIDDFEFSRTHWAIKDVDLFRFLYKDQIHNIATPQIFSFEDLNRKEYDLISVMMPFNKAFDEVYQQIQSMAATMGLKCLRADDIWKHDSIIQEIVSLICKSMIVICDCTGKNPNVFYEAGIAHSLGKNVILITQSEQDIPFDLRHLRYLRYLNNNEGRNELSIKLVKRIQTITESQ